MIEYILNLSDEEIAYICQQIGGSKFKKYYSQNPNKFAEIMLPLSQSDLGLG